MQVKKMFVSFDSLEKTIPQTLKTIQSQLFTNAKTRKEQILQQDGVMEHDVAQAGWCGDAACEAGLKEHKKTIRCLVDSKDHAQCFACDKPSVSDVIIARAY